MGFSLLEVGLKLIDRVIPDKEKKAEMQLKIMELNQAGEFKELDAQLQRDLAQAKINEVEAASDSLLKSGWRPAVGWVCVAGLAYTFLIAPIGTWICAMNGVDVVAPRLDMAELMGLLMGILGLGGYRSYEKKNGVAK